MGSKRDEAVAWVGSVGTKSQNWLAAHPVANAWVTLIRDVVVAQGENRASLAAAGAAFWLVIAIFPAVITAISIFGLVVSPEDITKALSSLGERAEGSLSNAITTQAEQFSGAATSSLTIGLIISLVVALWAVSNGAYNLARAIRVSFGVPNLGYVAARAKAFVGAILGVLALGLVAFLVVFLGDLNDRLTGMTQVIVSGLVIWPLVAILLIGGLVALFRFALGKGNSARSLIPGALVAAAALWGLFVLVSLAFASFGKSSAVYGIAAGSVSALISAYFVIYIVLLGAIIDAHWPGRRALIPFLGGQNHREDAQRSADGPANSHAHSDSASDSHSDSHPAP